MLRRRLTIRFAGQMIIVTLLLIIVATFIIAWMINEIEEIEMKRSFAPTGISKLIEEATIDKNGLIVNDSLLKQLEQNGTWLQSLDENGNVLQSFYTPDDVPKQYIPAQLMNYWVGIEPFPYDLGLWIQQKEDRLFIMLYGQEKSTLTNLIPIFKRASIADHSIILPESVQQKLLQDQAWMQVLDAEGNEIAAWNKPANAGNKLTLSQLALQYNYPERYGSRLQSYFDKETQLTWILHSPLQYSAGSLAASPDAELRVIIIGLVAFIIAAFVIMLSLAFGYASLFIRPIFQLVKWIQQLGSEQAKQSDNHQVTSSKQRKHLFKEVKDEIDRLALALAANKQAEAQTQAYREEWIAGVTHDMRTPLSSIQGYAHMLAAEQYSWSEQEVRSFASIILEKSQYIDQLIEDLSLTYRLRSGNLPIVLERHNIAIVLQEAVERVAVSHAGQNYNISCTVPREKKIYQNIHLPWFERIIHNLIVNAMLHNDSNTSIMVHLEALTKDNWAIHVQDSGKGMDQETSQRLFERYYRGTNTEQTSLGSGLGMAITKELVQAMGGKIKVTSQPNKGTTISLLWESNTTV